jgi:hypothetical protein
VDISNVTEVSKARVVYIFTVDVRKVYDPEDGGIMGL